ncbi:unnamed protein product, partial [Closterium sp. NIES-53]
MAKGIHLEADSTSQEFKLYHDKGGLYIGKAILKNNVFVLDFVPDLGTADSDGIVTFTSWTHPPDLDPDFSPEGFWYSHTIPEAERTRALATIQHSAAAKITSAAAETTSAAAETTSATAKATAAAAATSTPIAGPSTTSPQIDDTPPTPAQQLHPKTREGIKRLILLPYAHQQQGVAERMNRTLQNTMRKLLRGMQLPNHQWPEAMDHAVTLHNLLSSSSLPNNASPHVLWTGKQGSTKMLRVFGCMEQYRPPSARAGRFSQRAQWGLHLGIERNYNAWKIFNVHSKETVAARDIIFYKRLTLPTYLANLEENRDPTGGFHGDRHFASAADEADWDEQNVDNASKEAGPLPYCSVPIPMDDENPRESINADTYFDLADTGYVTPAEVNTNEAERIGPNFIPDPEIGNEAAYPTDTTLPRYTQSGLQILGLVTTVHVTDTPKEPATVQQALGGVFLLVPNILLVLSFLFLHMVLQRFDFTYSSPQATPMSTRHSLSALPSDESVEPSGPYPELVGCLMYLMTCTRPDLAYPLSILARYVAPGRHRSEHMAAAKRVLRYLCSTSGMGLVLGGRRPVVLTGHADASWADDQATQRSSQGYTFSLGSGSVSWRSTRSSSVLGSSCEAEIYAGAMAAQELRWLTYLLTDLGEQPRSPPVLYVDNKAMLALCREHILEHRTKHIALRYFLACELQQRGQLRLAYVASEANTADIFTKALAPGDHQRFCTLL